MAPKAAVEAGSKPLKKSGSQLHRLACAAQNYAWGRHPEDSEVRVERPGRPTTLDCGAAAGGAPRRLC